MRRPRTRSPGLRARQRDGRATETWGYLSIENRNGLVDGATVSHRVGMPSAQSPSTWAPVCPREARSVRTRGMAVRTSSRARVASGSRRTWPRRTGTRQWTVVRPRHPGHAERQRKRKRGIPDDSTDAYAPHQTRHRLDRLEDDHEPVKTPAFSASCQFLAPTPTVCGGSP